MRHGYQTDLSDQEWKILEPLIPPAKAGGRPRKQDMRKIVNAIYYLLRTGCAWEMLPKDFPPKSTVFHYFNTWRKNGTWKNINDALVAQVRHLEGRQEQPTAGIIDSQSVKTADTAEDRGYDAGKKINGRKRHILVDTIGMILMVVVHVGSIQDRDGAKLVFERAKTFFPSLKLIWADGGYAGQLINWVALTCNWLLEIVKRSDDIAGFYVLPRRWVVERTFGWFAKYRRLSKDYEYHTQTSEAVIYACMSHIMLRRIARAETS
jgi:putative transposase